MSNFYVQRLCRYICACVFLSASVFITERSFAQIFAPEGLHASGLTTWPNNGVALPSGQQNLNNLQSTGGGVQLITLGTRRWHGVLTGLNNTNWLFTSGPTSGYYNNKWANTNVVFNTMQTYTHQGGTDNNITASPTKYYTFNWWDQGYTSTQAVWMETTNNPVTVSSTVQSPVAASVTPADPVDITVTTSASLSPEEKVYVRWTTNSYSTSTLALVGMVGNSGTVQIPAQVDGTTVQYYVITSTGTNVQIGTDYDMFTINSGTGYSYTSTALPPVNITFQVNMANEAVSVNGLHLAASFNSFSTSALALSLVSGTIYDVTVPLAQGSIIDYKYVNGNTGSDFETVPGACNVSGNRQYVVGSSDATINLHCYGTCTACVAPVPVKFQVNMTGLTVSVDGVHVAGNFGSLNPTWNPGGIALTHVGGGVYETTINIVPGRTVPYKYINGNSWGNEEGVPGACNIGGNREIVIPGSATTLPLNCFGTCSNCVSVTFNVDMNGLVISGNGVHVAGFFQSWNPGTTALTHVGGGIYSATVNVDPNISSDFKYVNGNAWGFDESAPNVCGSGGNRNFSVGTTNKVLPVVCFNRCIACNATSNWTGANDGNFSNGNNWTAGVPPTGCSYNLQINQASNQPTLGAGTLSSGNVTINPGAILTINSGATLAICGDVTGGGTFTGAGKVELTGTPAQNLTGTTTYSNLTLTKPSTTTITGTANIKGVLTLSNSTSNVVIPGGGKLVLASDASTTGSIGPIPAGATVSGSVTQQRYLPGTGNGWFYLGTPISGGDFSQWTDNMYMAAGTNLGGAQGVVSLGNQHATIFKHSEPNAATYVDTVQKYGWRVPTTSDALTVGQGFRVWLKGYNTPSRIVDNVGNVTQGNFSFPSLTRTEVANCQPNQTASTIIPCTEAFRGWNLIANPYPSAIDWNSASITKDGRMNNAFYIWNSAAGGYRAYNGSGATDLGVTVTSNVPANVIPSSQAFFVKLTTAGSYSAPLSIQEGAKVGTSGQFVRSAVVASNQVRIRLNNAAQANYQFDAMLKFDNAATYGFDQHLDMDALPGSAFEFHLEGENGEALLLNTVPFVNHTKVIPMTTTYNGVQGTFTFSFIDAASITNGAQVYLRDKFLGVITSLSVSDQYTFQVSEGSNNADRFELILAPNAVTGVSKQVNGASFGVYPNPSNGSALTLAVNGLNDSEGSVTVTDLMGKVVYQSSVALEKGSAARSLNLNAASGVYTVKFVSKSHAFTEKLIVK